MFSKIGDGDFSGIKKTNITPIWPDLYSIYRQLCKTERLVDQTLVVAYLWGYFMRGNCGEQLYTASNIEGTLAASFAKNRHVTLILNDHIGDTILMLQAIRQISLIKTISIYTKHTDLCRSVIDAEIGWGLSISIHSFEHKSPPPDIGDILENGFSINFHRYFNHPRCHLSLDWRMIPLISAQYFNYPDRLSLFLQIFLGYKVKSIKTLSSSSKKDTILIVPFSSLSEKDIANETWIEIIQMALYAYPKIQIHILQNTEGKNIVIPPTVKDRISYVQGSLSEIHTYMRKRQPYVISCDTGIGHLAGYAGLQTILLFTLGNSRFWSYTKPNIHCIPSALSNFLEINDYGLYDPAWGNSLPTPELDQLLELNAHSAEYIFHLISLYLGSSTSSDTEKQTTNP